MVDAQIGDAWRELNEVERERLGAIQDEVG